MILAAGQPSLCLSFLIYNLGLLMVLVSQGFCEGYMSQCLPRWLSDKESACNAGDTGDLGSIPGLARSPGEGHGNPLQYSCLKNPMDRGIQRATVDGVTESDMTEQLTL